MIFSTKMSLVVMNILSSVAVIAFISAIGGMTPLAEGTPVRSDYFQMRQEMISRDRANMPGSNLVLNSQEKLVSDFLVKEKRKLIESTRVNLTEFFPALSFYKSKAQINNSSIYKIIKKMPKGAALHIHDQSVASLDWLVKNVTYRDNLYMCVNSEHFMIFKFLSKPVPNPGCEWKSVKAERAKAADTAAFDESIKKNISLLSIDPVTAYTDVNDVWRRFNMYFAQVIGMIFHTPVFGDYFAQALEEFYEDNVQYFELRGQLWGIRDLDGTDHDAEFGLNIYRNVTSHFVKTHPDFAGAKFIMSGLRFVKKQDIMGQIKVAMDLYKRYPESFLGYDLVGQEDPNNPLVYYADQLLYPSEQSPPVHLPYFFHAAETKWQGTVVDDNLVDALLMNTTRIGHGYGIPKHPYLARMIKKDQVPIEVNPISNQLLGLVVDPRNHPIVPLISDDFAVVISSDDPATWEAAPMSHDFFVAFMTMTGENDDLSFLKQMAMNSINYSAMTDQEKKSTMTLWQSKWDKFITESVSLITKGNIF